MLFCFVYTFVFLLSNFVVSRYLLLIERSNTLLPMSVLLCVDWLNSFLDLPNVLEFVCSNSFHSICFTLSNLVFRRFLALRKFLPWNRLLALRVKFYPDLGVRLGQMAFLFRCRLGCWLTYSADVTSLYFLLNLSFIFVCVFIRISLLLSFTFILYFSVQLTICVCEFSPRGSWKVEFED